MVSLEVLTQTFEKLWPLESADSWDRPGLAFGSKTASISKVLLSVDVTAAIIQEAIDKGAQLVVAHHPPLLRGVSELGEQTIKGHIAALAIKNDIAVYSAHTNADKSAIGTATALVAAIDAEMVSVLDDESSHGAICELKASQSLISLASKLAKVLPSVAAGIKVAGDPESLIRKVAIAPGSGDSFMPQALAAGVDLFISSDLRHHPAQDFLESNELGQQIALMDISHWAAEWMWLPLAQSELSAQVPELEFVISEIRTDPWDFAVMQ